MRNSILGLFVTIVSLELLKAWRSPYPVNRWLKPGLIILAVILAIITLFNLLPDSYFVERVRQAIPQLQRGHLIISPASNIYGRVDYARTALLIFWRHPLIGGGFWSYKTLSGLWGPQSIVHAHNSYLQTLAELGSAGALALGWLIWRIGRCLRCTRPHPNDSLWHVRLWEVTVGSLLFIAFTALFSNPFWEPTEVGFRMVLLGALLNYRRERK